MPRFTVTDTAPHISEARAWLEKGVIICGGKQPPRVVDTVEARNAADAVADVHARYGIPTRQLDAMRIKP